MRYNEQVLDEQNPKKPKKEERELPKAGKYESEDLYNVKERPFIGGNYNG